MSKDHYQPDSETNSAQYSPELRVSGPMLPTTPLHLRGGPETTCSPEAGADRPRKKQRPAITPNCADHMSNEDASTSDMPPHRDPKSILADNYRGLCRAGDRFEVNPPRLVPAQRQHKPALWQFVDLFLHPDSWYLADSEVENKHAAFAFCRNCKVSIYFATSNHKIASHMNKYHKTAMEAYENRERQAKQTRLARTLTPSLDQAADRIRKITAEQQEHANKLLAEWISAHFRPLGLVEDEGFLEYISYITHDLGQVNVSIPKRNQLRGFIRRLASELRAEVRNDIDKHCVHFSMTSDIWTARNAQSFMAFTIHYLTDNFELRNWTLEVVEIPGKPTGRAIKAKLIEVMEKWGLRKENCTRFVHDSGSNMVNAAELLEFAHTPCLAHELHLVVSGALLKQKKSFESELPAWAPLVDEDDDARPTDRDVDEVLTEQNRREMENLRDLAIDEMLEFSDKVFEDLEKNAMETIREIVQSFRALSVYFRRSAKAHHRLADIQLKGGDEKSVNMIVDCPTRWNSCLDMLQRSMRLQKPLDALFQHLHSEEGSEEFKDVSKKLSKPKHKDWLVIDCLNVLLKPFATVSSTLGAQNYPTLPLVMSALDAIEAALDNPRLFDSKLNAADTEEYVGTVRVLMTDVRKTILRVFKKRFDKFKSTELGWIAYLDPRIAKTMNHVKPANVKKNSQKVS